MNWIHRRGVTSKEKTYLESIKKQRVLFLNLSCFYHQISLSINSHAYLSLPIYDLLLPSIQHVGNAKWEPISCPTSNSFFIVPHCPFQIHPSRFHSTPAGFYFLFRSYKFKNIILYIFQLKNTINYNKKIQHHLSQF